MSLDTKTVRYYVIQLIVFLIFLLLVVIEDHIAVSSTAFKLQMKLFALCYHLIFG